MHESWFRIRVPSLPRPVVVLDVSAAATGLWPVLHSTLVGLAESLPESAWPDVAFLGGSSRIGLGDVLSRVDSLHAANAGRGRVISPLLDVLPAPWPGRIVLLAVRPIVDLGDWAVTPLGERLAVVRLDPSEAVAGGFLQEEDLGDIGSVSRLVDLPSPTLRISARNALPIGWDNRSLFFDEGRLVSTAPGDTYVGLLSATEQPEIVAELVRPNLDPDRLPVARCEPPAAQPWQSFSAAELTLLDAWRGGRPAFCSACRAEHEPGAVACASGAWAFPSLARVPCGEFVRIRVKLFQATFQLAGPVLRLGETAVVVHGQRPKVWRFDGNWKATAEPWGRFERIASDDEFALALLAGGSP